MRAGTRPAVALLANGTYEIAYESSAGYLTLYNLGAVTGTGLPMKSGTSPSISASGGGFEAAMQADTGVLWTYGTGIGMAAGTSPAITALAVGGGYETAIHESTGDFALWGVAGDLVVSQTMYSGASPTITW
jgi:hypothetical protein